VRIAATEPLRIDVLIIKNTADIVIKKNIAAIFRRVNIIEYKRPGDTFSRDDFSKTQAYCGLYSYLNKTPLPDITLSLVVNRYPRTLVQHLRSLYQWEVVEWETGIYRVSGGGMAFPIQIIESGKLPAGENLWLGSLRSGLTAESLHKLLRESARRGDTVAGELLETYIQMILRANTKILEEVMAMRDAKLDAVLERSGITAKWEARGRAEGKALAETQERRRFIKLLKSGKSPEELLKLYEEKE
jgi:hypothetical protein